MRLVPPLLALQVDHHAGAGGVGGGGWTQLLVLPFVQSTLRPLKLHQLWSGTVDIVHVVVDDTRVVPI